MFADKQKVTFKASLERKSPAFDVSDVYLTTSGSCLFIWFLAIRMQIMPGYSAPPLFSTRIFLSAQTAQFVRARVNPSVRAKTGPRRVFHAPCCCARPSLFPDEIFHAAAARIFSKSLLAAAFGIEKRSRNIFTVWKAISRGN